MDNYNFIVFAVETLGPWCPEAKALVQENGKKLEDITEDTRASNFLRQRISIAIQKGNVMGTFPHSQVFQEIVYF